MSRSIFARLPSALCKAASLTAQPRAAHLPRTSPFHSSAAAMSNNKNLDSETISEITRKEKKLTGESRPVKGGPTAQAQKHAGETVNADNISDITQGEKKITGEGAPVAKGPAAMAQSLSTSVGF